MLRRGLPGRRRSLRDRVEPAGALRIAPRAHPRAAPGRQLARRLVRPASLVGAGLVLAGLAVLLGAGSSAGGPERILVATRTLPGGSVLRAADLHSAAIGAGNGVLATLVPAAEEGRVLGETLSGPLSPDEPLVRSALSAGGEPAAFTLTVGAEHALGGALRVGDWIGVLATFETGSGGEVTRELARRLLVLAVGQPPSIGDPSEATVPVTVALPDPALAPRLALANSSARIDIVRDGDLAGPALLPTASAPGSGE
jgi:Flp pilus assembly protein CpaB